MRDALGGFPGHCNAGWRSMSNPFTVGSVSSWHRSRTPYLWWSSTSHASSPWRWRPSFELTKLVDTKIQAWAGITSSSESTGHKGLACMMHQASLLTTTTSFANQGCNVHSCYTGSKLWAFGIHGSSLAWNRTHQASYPSVQLTPNIESNRIHEHFCITANSGTNVHGLTTSQQACMYPVYRSK